MPGSAVPLLALQQDVFTATGVNCPGAWSQGRPECDGASRPFVFTHRLAHGARQFDSV